MSRNVVRRAVKPIKNNVMEVETKATIPGISSMVHVLLPVSL